jgi:hypothetical protein
LPWSKMYVPCARSVSPRELSTLPGRLDCPIAAAARCRPEFSPSTHRGARLFGRATLANPHDARRSQECGSSAALPLAACAARGRYHMEKCRWQRRFSSGPRHPLMRRGNCFGAAALAHKIPDCDVPEVLTAYDRAAYIGGSRCAVRLGVTARLRSSSPIRASYADPASDFGRKQGTSTSPTFGEWGHPVPGCLTSESEERETWTAESLRAVSRGQGNLRAATAGRDFGGTRFRSTPRYSCEQSCG